MPGRRHRHAKAKARRQRKGRGKKKTMGQHSNKAVVIETVEYNDILPNTTYNYSFQLSDFQRASRVASAYKWYKAAKVEWIIEPLFNTFQESSTASTTVPVMYTIMNRTQSALVYNKASLEAMGAFPQRMNRQIIKTYRPNWCQGGLNLQSTAQPLTGVAAMGLIQKYDWLACPEFQNYGTASALGVLPPANVAPFAVPGVQTNTVLYNGHDTYVDQANIVSGQAVARVSARIYWEFKDPVFYAAERATDAVVKASPLDRALLNNATLNEV